MKVLVADKLDPAALDEMRTLGVELTYQPELSADALPAAVRDVNVLVVRGTQVRADAMRAGVMLNLIIRAGAGVRNIDVKTASERGIYVANCPGKNASGVAELTLTLIGCLDRRVPDAVSSLRAGKWDKQEFAKAKGLRGRTLGIVGFGHVGRAVAKLGLAYGLDVHAYSRSLMPAAAADAGVGWAPNVLELAKRSEILCVHLELTERTRGIISRDVIAALPNGAMLINTADSGLVDWPALVELGPMKELRVGLDVLPSEPDTRVANYDHAILHAGLVYATPHIGASTDEAQIAIAAETVRILRSFMVKGEVPNVVNIAASTRGRYVLVVRFLDKVGALANVLGVLKRHAINIQELENTVFEGGRAGCAKIRTDTRPSEACLSEMMAFSDEVLHVNLVTLPNLA
ncbi:MAG: D-3-phosphoglycerate dehydrogenase [Myxococcales bacterium]|nr:D-3-phosphoglycerate dehydrogenase [Myxococcales bacterium]